MIPRRIPLSRRDGAVVAHVLLDREDHIRFGSQSWCLSDEGYAVSRLGLLHRLILDAPVGMEVDHRNRDRLDCRRSNLRLATRALNAQNVSSRGGTSQHRGVHFDSQTRALKKWVAQVKVGGRRVLYRRFATEAEAAHAAVLKRKEVMPYG